MIPMRKYSLFGMYIYHRILMTLSFKKFHPTGTTYLKIAPGLELINFPQAEKEVLNKIMLFLLDKNSDSTSRNEGFVRKNGRKNGSH